MSAPQIASNGLIYGKQAHSQGCIESRAHVVLADGRRRKIIGLNPNYPTTPISPTPPNAPLINCLRMCIRTDEPKKAKQLPKSRVQ